MSRIFMEYKKNKSLIIILTVGIFLSVIFFISLIVRVNKEKTESGYNAVHEYAPPVNYPLSPGEKYTPSFP